MTRLPRLLDGSLSEVRRLHPVSLGIDQQLFALSTATMVLPPGETVSVRDWVELYTPVESAGIFRVVSADTDYSSGQLSVKLEHGICALGDAIVSEHATSQTQTTRSPTGTAVDTSRFTNLPDAEIGYTLSQSTALVDAEISGTASEVLSSLIGYQTIQTGGQNLWQVGQGDTGQQQVTVTVQYSNVLQMVNQVMDQLHGYYLDYDQSSLPWTMRVLQIPSGVTAEGRLSRNVNAARISYDTGDLCTKVYCEQATGGCAVSQRASVWGLVEHHLSIDSNASAAEADAACQRYLENREDPKISVTIDMRELSRITGDELDRIRLAKLYRLALPDYAVSVDEMVVGVSWRDVFTAPDVCSVTLANHAADLVVSISRIAEEATVARTTAARATAVAEKAQAETEVSKYELVVTKEAVDTLGTRLRQAGIEIDENGVWIFAIDTTGSTGIGASLKVNADAIAAEVSRATGAESGLSSRIGLTEDNVSAAYGRIETVEGKVSTIEGSTLWANENSIVTVTGKMSVDNNGNLVVSEGTGLYATRNNVKYGIFDTGNLTAGVIVQKINGGTGETGDTTLSTEILGDKIKLTTGSGASTFTLSDKIIIDSDGYTKVNGLFMASGTGINAKHVTINNGKVTAGGGVDISAAQSLTFVGSGSTEYYAFNVGGTGTNATDIKKIVTGFGTVTFNASTGKATIPYSTVRYPTAGAEGQNIEVPTAGLITAVSVGNNTLTLTKSDGTYVNFSKATTLTGVWGSGSKAGTYIVNATQTNINTTTGQPETTNVGSWDIRFGDTIGGADVALNAVIGTGNPDATGSNIIFPVNIGTATSGTMTTQVSLTRSVNCEAVRGMATSNALTVESQTDAQWADLTDVTDISSSITGGGKYLITATPKYGTAVQKKFIAPSGSSVDVDVVKGAWTYAGIGTIYQTSTCEFYPSSGNGAHQYVEIQQDIYIPESLTYSGSLYFKDNYSHSIVGSGRFYLQQHENFVFATINNDPVSLENAIARLAITGSGTQRSVSSLSQVILNANHTTATQYPVTVTYDNNTTGSSTITVDASAISGGSGSDDRVVTSLTPNPIVLTSSQTQTSSHTLTAHYSTGSDSTIAVSINASAVYAEGMSVGGDVDIQSGRVINITTNNTSNTYYATGAYDAMSSVIVNVNIPDTGGTITDITAPSIAGNQLVSNVTLTASGTNVAAPYTESATLAKSTYNVGSFTKDCVTLTIDNNVVGRIATGYTKATVTLLSGAPVYVTSAITSSAFRLTGAGYRRLFYYSDTEDRYIDAAVDGRAHYWYYSSSHVNTGDYAPMGTYTQYYPMSSVYTDTDTYYTKDS